MPPAWLVLVLTVSAVVIKGVVVLAPPHLGHGKARAELHALHSGDGKDKSGHAIFHAVQHGVTQAHRQAGDAALDQAAQGVQFRPGLLNGSLHLLPGGIVQHGEALLARQQQVFRRHVHRVIGGIQDPADARDVRPNGDAPPGQDLLADPPGDAQGRGQAAGKMPAAGHILPAAVF